MSLPLPWVDKIFEKLTLVYGQQFLARWRDVDLELVKSDWARELGGFEQKPEAIAYALQNLDAEKPPTVLVFRAIALRSPAAVLARLPEPAANPERMAAELAKFASIRQAGASSGYDHKAWARRLKAGHEAGDKLSAFQVQCYREALRMTA
jgi:hypothetical protein